MITDHHNRSSYTNYIEVRAYGLKRSGNHAIIEWILDQHAGEKCCFLNNIHHGALDPYTNYVQLITKEIDYEADIERLRNTSKHLLVYSYEDRQHTSNPDADLLSSAFQDQFEKTRSNYLGRSRHTFDLMIIRDPFNCFASRIRLCEKNGPKFAGIQGLEVAARNWKLLARRALELEKSPVSGQIVVNYNTWVIDSDYRMALSRQLLGEFNDSATRKISRFGGGSSFSVKPLRVKDFVIKRRKLLDLRRYKRIGHYLRRAMAPRTPGTLKESAIDELFSRWKSYADNESYRNVFRDKELVSLSESLFGEIPGTQSFLDSLGQPSKDQSQTD